jgi:threonine dehydratase
MLVDYLMDLGREAIAGVERLIRPHVRRTPVLRAGAREFALDGAELNFKLELFQHSGSFKARGAFANLLTREVPRAGVVAASGGNHGAAVAYAANRLGVPARIYVPTVSSPAKIALIRSYGADLVVEGDRYADALAAAEKWADGSGAMKIHAYDEPGAILGQGSVGLEWEQDAPDLDTVLVAVGGGGLLGGIAAWYEGKTRIVGVEPAAAPTLSYALKAGRPVDAPAGGIAADSLAPRRVGELMLPLAQKYVERVVLVEDEAIRRAQHALWSALRVVAEPGGAAAFAALLSGTYLPSPGERVGVLICGGNTTAVDFGK